MAGFDVNVSYVFLHGLLEAITFGVGLVSDGGARVCAGCEMGLLLCSVASITCRGWGLLPSRWSGSPDGWALSWLCSLQVCVFSFSCTRTFALKQRNAKASGAYSLTLVIH